MRVFSLHLINKQVKSRDKFSFLNFNLGHFLYSIFKSRWKREGKRAATRQYSEYGEEPHSVADEGNA